MQICEPAGARPCEEELLLNTRLTEWVASVYLGLVAGANFFGTQFGDSTLDRIVDANDLADVRSNTGQNVGWAGGNFDLNDIVDINDVATLQGNFGLAASLSPPTAPELGTPLSITLLALAILRRRSSKLRGQQLLLCMSLYSLGVTQ